MPEWINDRNPNSPGFYLTNEKCEPGCLTIRNLLCYFDGANWLYPFEITAEIEGSELYFPPLDVEWMKIELGKD